MDIALLLFSSRVKAVRCWLNIFAKLDRQPYSPQQTTTGIVAFHAVAAGDVKHVYWGADTSENRARHNRIFLWHRRPGAS